jgi:hypothetical protein
MIQNMKGRWLTILLDGGYSVPQAQGWLQGGVLPRLVEWTFDAYDALLQSAMNQVYKLSWEDAYDFIQHHGSELPTIRMHATSRLLMLLHNYCYLRNSRRQKFLTDKLQAKILRNLQSSYRQTHAVTISSPGPMSVLTTPTLDSHVSKESKKTSKGCPKCGTSLHGGNIGKCPLSNLSNGVAHHYGALFANKMSKDGSLTFKTLCQKVLDSLPPAMASSKSSSSTTKQDVAGRRVLHALLQSFSVTGLPPFLFPFLILI